MKLQSASLHEVKRIACGTAAGGILLVAAMFVLSRIGIGTFDYRVLTGALGGCIVAVINFALMCVTIQRAVNIGEHPTAPGGRMTVEANLIGYEGGEFYGCHMRLLLCRRLRAEKKFDSLEALREEVMRNRTQTVAYFKEKATEA